jgi:DNA modification methylase
MGEIILGDCLEVMKNIEDKSISLILTDLPFGMTKNEWDKKLSLDKLWEEYKKIIKDNGAILLFAKGVFAAELIMSNKEMYRYSYVWVKNKTTGHLNANRMPMQATEDILVFYKKLPVYNPQKTGGHSPVHAFYTRKSGSNYNQADKLTKGGGSTERYPSNVLYFNVAKNRKHPTEKPVELLEFLIRTYTNEGDVVLDSCCGSGSLAAACINVNRDFICIEKEEKFYNLSLARIME